MDIKDAVHPKRRSNANADELADDVAVPAHVAAFGLGQMNGGGVAAYA